MELFCWNKKMTAKTEQITIIWLPLMYFAALEPESAFISYYVNQPYIFALFNTDSAEGVYLNLAPE